jgi:starch synthase
LDLLEDASMKVVFASPELAPFSKTGGLADVAAALPAALAERGVEITVMSPLYRSAREKAKELAPLAPPSVAVAHGPHQVEVGLLAAKGAGGVRIVFLRYDPYFDRPDLYGPPGGEFPDNAHRFALFSKAVLAASEALSLRANIFHVNDWQSALVCALLKKGRGAPSAKSVLTIHNMGYQGIFWKHDLPWTGLDWSLFTPDGIEYYDKVNYLKAGIVFADSITTVSPSYAREIQESPEQGHGLDGVLRTRVRDLTGILNGIDTSVWNPSLDAYIPARYSAGDLAGKRACKAKLQEELGLPVSPAAPLIGSVGRLAEQKGMGLLIRASDKLFEREPDCQLAVLGEGHPAVEKSLLALAAERPRSVKVVIGFNEGLAHRIEAGADMFVMPSQYEPCGLNQMYSMAYGTVPIVRRTGGLADTVKDARDGTAPDGTGFVFTEFSEQALLDAIFRATAAFRSGELWTRLMKRAMSRDWSWGRSALEYIALYERLLERR